MKKAVALVDDEEVFHWIVKKNIEHAKINCELLSFYNGQEILDHLKDPSLQRPDIILLDLNMPVLGGWQFLEEYAEECVSLDIVIYIVTSSIDPEDLNRAKKIPCVKDFISKPLTSEILEKLLS